MRARAVPEFWLVVAIPLLGVLAGLATVAIAVASGPSDPVVSPFERRGLVQTLLDGPGREAARRGLEGTLRIDRERRLAMVELRGAGAGDGPLWLTLAHPTRAALDLRVRLAPLGGGRHAGALKLTPARHGQALLEPEDRAWRLAGRYREGEPGALRPGAGLEPR